jgi:hypothetical protein
MSLQEARSVLWLRNNPRPLGELLDEGYLTEQRLAWAAEKAYDKRLKHAAKVLLDSIKQGETSARGPLLASPTDSESLPQIQTGLTVEQARAVRWPFRPFKDQSMGALVDTRQLGVGNLAYAIENAWDERVRQAAVVLMAVRLSQVIQEPPPPVGPLKVVSAGRSYSERRQFVWTFALGTMIGAIGVLCLLLAALVVRALASASDSSALKGAASPAGIVVLLILVALTVGVGWPTKRLLDLALKKLERQIESYRIGQEGEEEVVEALRQSLDGNWTLFRNVTLPGRNKADIDLVLVGPPGVWALEVKTLSGEYRNIGEQWKYRAGNRWRLLSKNPSRQVHQNATRLSRFLREDGVRQWVTPAVAWANRTSPLSVKNPMVAVWTLDRLPEELGNIWQGQAISAPVLERIVEKLTALCQSRNDEESD